MNRHTRRKNNLIKTEFFNINDQNQLSSKNCGLGRGVCMCTRGDRGWCQVSSSTALTLLFETGSFSDLVSLPGQQAPAVCFSCSATPGIFTWCWGRNSGPSLHSKHFAGWSISLAPKLSEKSSYPWVIGLLLETMTKEWSIRSYPQRFHFGVLQKFLKHKNFNNDQ